MEEKLERKPEESSSGKPLGVLLWDFSFGLKVFKERICVLEQEPPPVILSRDDTGLGWSWQEQVAVIQVRSGCHLDSAAEVGSEVRLESFPRGS